jgi:hypothetical protein
MHQKLTQFYHNCIQVPATLFGGLAKNMTLNIAPTLTTALPLTSCVTFKPESLTPLAGRSVEHTKYFHVYKYVYVLYDITVYKVLTNHPHPGCALSSLTFFKVFFNT